MRALRTDLTEAGVFRHHEAAGWLRLGLLMSLLGTWLYCIGRVPTWIILVTTPLVAAVCTTAAMLGHEGSHGSFSSQKWQNRLLTNLVFPLLSGLSAVYWRNKHDAAHHGHPNVLGQDPDVKMWPFVSSQEEHEDCSPGLRWVQKRAQGYLFWPMTLLQAIAMRRSSIRFLVKYARTRGPDRAWRIDVTLMTVHYAAWLGLGTLAWGFWPAMAVYFGMWAIVGSMLAMIFVPAHVGLPVLSDQHNDWQHQLETTRNFRTPRWFSWFFVGLDYQVEHHLFPKIPHQQLPRARNIVRAWCRKNRLPHHEDSYPEALASVTRALQIAWRTPTQTRDQVRSASASAPLRAAA